MIAGKAVGSSGDVVFSRTRDVILGQEAAQRGVNHEEAPIRRVSQTYVHPQVYVNNGYASHGSHHASSASQYVHRVTPSKTQQPERERSRSRSRTREESGHAAMNENGHHHRSHSREHYPRADVDIPHSRPPVLSEEARQRNQLSRSKAAHKRLHEEAELKMRDEAARRERMRVAKEAAIKRTSEFARQQTEKQARQVRSTLDKLETHGGIAVDAIDREVNRTNFTTAYVPARVEMQSRSEFIEPIGTAPRPPPRYQQPQSQQQSMRRSSREPLQAPTASVEPEIALPAERAASTAPVRASQSAWNAEMNSDGVAGIFEAISAAQNAVPRLSYQRLIQDRPDLLESYKAQLRAEPETTHEIVPDIPLRLRRSNRASAPLPAADGDDAAMYESQPRASRASASPPSASPRELSPPRAARAPTPAPAPASASAIRQPVINPRASSPPRYQPPDREALAPFHDMVLASSRAPVHYNAQENARKIRHAQRMKAREDERRKQERKEKLKQLNAAAAASRMARKRQLKRTSESTTPHRRPVSAEPRSHHVARQPYREELSRSTPAMEYLAPAVHHSPSEASDSFADPQHEPRARMTSTAPASSKARSPSGRARTDINEGRYLKRSPTTHRPASPPWMTSTTSSRRRPRPASPSPQRTALDDIYDDLLDNGHIECEKEPVRPSRRRNRVSVVATRGKSPHRERHESPAHTSRTSPTSERRPLYASPDGSDSADEHPDSSSLRQVVGKTADFRDDLAELYDQLNVEVTTKQLQSDSDFDGTVADYNDNDYGHAWVPEPVRQSVSPTRPARVEPRASPARAALLSRQEHELVAHATRSPPLPRTDLRSDAEWVLAKHGVFIEDGMEFPQLSPGRRMASQPARIRLPESDVPSTRRQATRQHEDIYHRSAVPPETDDHDPFSIVDRLVKRSRPSTRSSFEQEPYVVAEDNDVPLRGSLDRAARRSQHLNHAVTQTDIPPSPDRRDISVEALLEEPEDEYQPRSYWDNFLRAPIRHDDHADFLPPEAEVGGRAQRLSPTELHWQMASALAEREELMNVEVDLERAQLQYVQGVQAHQLAALSADVDRAASRHKQAEDDLYAHHQRELAWRDEVIEAALREAELDAQQQVQEYQQYANDEIVAGFMELGAERAYLQGTRDAMERQRATERLTRPSIITSMAATQTAEAISPPEVHASPADDTYSDDFDISGLRSDLGRRREVEEPAVRSPKRREAADLVSRSIQATADLDLVLLDNLGYDSDMADLDPVDDLAELQARLARCRQRSQAVENQLTARRQAGFRTLEEMDRQAVSGSVADLEDLAVERAAFLEDYKQRIGALEKQLYQLNTKEFQLLRAILRLTAPESEQRADDETISVLSSLLEVPAAGDGREVSTRYSRPAAAHERYGDEEVMSELSSPRERVPSNQESIPEDDGYSSSFDEESAALVRHRQHHSPLHSVSYIADEHQSVSEESVSSAELEARDRELQSRQQDVWQRVMKHLKSQQKAEKLQQQDREQATLELAARFLAWLEQARTEGVELPDQLSNSQLAELVDTMRESQGETLEPEVAISVQSAISVQTDRSREEPPRDSVESVPDAEYSSFANTGSGPGILESPHPSSEDMNRSVELHLQREQELLRALAERDREVERLRTQLEEQRLRERQLQEERERARQEQEERLRREQQQLAQQQLAQQQLAQQQAALARQQQQAKEEEEDEIDEELSREETEYSISKRELQSEVYDDSFASSSGLYPDMVAAASAKRDDADKAPVEREESGGYEFDTFATDEDDHAESIADVASIAEELRSEDGSTQEEDQALILQSSTSPEDGLGASMSVEAFEGSISHADVVLPVDRHKDAGAEQEPQSLATAEDAFVDSVQDAVAEGSAGPLHLRMTDSRCSMSDDDYGEAHSIDSDSFMVNGSELGSPVPPSRHELRSPTRDMVPAAPELDTIEEEDHDALRAPTPTDQLEASVSVENLEGSISYADLTMPVAATRPVDYVDIITNKLMAEMLQEVADETAQYGDATEVEEPIEEPSPAAQTPKLELTQPDPSSTVELRLSDPTDLEDSTDDLYNSVAAHTPQVIRAPRASSSRTTFDDDLQDVQDTDNFEQEFPGPSTPRVLDQTLLPSTVSAQDQIVDQSRKWSEHDQEFCQELVTGVNCWDALYEALQDPATPPQIDNDSFFQLQRSLWDRMPDQSEEAHKIVGTRNYAHFERVNHILQDLHTIRHTAVGKMDLPTRLLVEAVNSGDALRDHVAAVLDRERQEYKRSLERKNQPEQICKLAPISVSAVQQRAETIEGDLIDRLVEALMHSLLVDTTHAVLEVM